MLADLVCGGKHVRDFSACEKKQDIIFMGVTGTASPSTSTLFVNVYRKTLRLCRCVPMLPVQWAKLCVRAGDFYPRTAPRGLKGLVIWSSAPMLRPWLSIVSSILDRWDGQSNCFPDLDHVLDPADKVSSSRSDSQSLIVQDIQSSGPTEVFRMR